MKKVSVIIPVYNVEAYLPKCLDSVTGQSYANLEIICVDDGTPDNSVEIIKKYAEKDKRITLISQKNQGLSGARNTGVKAASGEYTVFLDSDDWLDTQAVKAAVEAAEKENADAVLWGYVREFGEKSAPKKIFDGDRVFNAAETQSEIHRRMAGLSGGELARPENADAVVTAWGKLYKTRLIKENGLEFVDTKIIGTEDALFNLQYFGFVKKCVFLDKPFNHYRKDNETSLTRSYKAKLPSQWAALYSMMEQHIKKAELPEAFNAALKNRICLSMVGLGLNELCNAAGHTERIKNIKAILCSQMYREAYKSLSLSAFPPHWKVFFAFCKTRFAPGVYALLLAMQRLIEK